ncbi:hypothetical protein K0M31_012144 [Melipona bicolor]|uniref:Integrase catalytic domain-containing protein n=1 Tax=Melipona bicolor TaxID=60889 RepID=A0AA40GAX7_9HYME|nr:hypothetical protein K0M31_012144 [Melipona bicolor]
MSPNIEWMNNIRDCQTEINLAECGKSMKSVAMANINIVTESIEVLFKNRKADIIGSDEEIIAQAHEINCIYILRTRLIRDCRMSTERKLIKDPDSKLLWHRRLGHMCVMPTSTLGGGRYMLVIVNDYSRYTSVFIMKTKDEAYNYFLEYMAKNENKLEKKIKIVSPRVLYTSVRFPIIAKAMVWQKELTALSWYAQCWPMYSSRSVFEWRLQSRPRTSRTRRSQKQILYTPIEKWEGYKLDVRYMKELEPNIALESLNCDNCTDGKQETAETNDEKDKETETPDVENTNELRGDQCSVQRISEPKGIEKYFLSGRKQKTVKGNVNRLILKYDARRNLKQKGTKRTRHTHSHRPR